MRTLPDNACPSCGVLMAEAVGTLVFPVAGQEIQVPDIPHLKCPACGEVLLSLDSAKLLRERARALATGTPK